MLLRGAPKGSNPKKVAWATFVCPCAAAATASSTNYAWRGRLRGGHSAGGLDQAFAWLERAYRQKDAWLWTIKLDQVDPLLKDFARDTRFAHLLRKMNCKRLGNSSS